MFEGEKLGLEYIREEAHSRIYIGLTTQQKLKRFRIFRMINHTCRRTGSLWSTQIPGYTYTCAKRTYMPAPRAVSNGFISVRTRTHVYPYSCACFKKSLSVLLQTCGGIRRSIEHACMVLCSSFSCRFICTCITMTTCSPVGEWIMDIRTTPSSDCLIRMRIDLLVVYGIRSGDQFAFL
jgi:hypothetical protein